MEQARKETDRKPVEVWEDVEREPAETTWGNQPRRLVVPVVVAAGRVVMDWEEAKTVLAQTVAARALNRRFSVTLNQTNVISPGSQLLRPRAF